MSVRPSFDEMNDSLPLEVTTPALYSARDIIDDDLAYILLMVLDTLKLVISVPSMVLNGMNVFIYCTMGALDSVTVSLLFLSVADLLTVSLYSVTAVNEIFTLLGYTWANDITTYVLSMVFSFSTEFAAAVTTYIAAQRGLCVALPFLTRHLFNKNKSVVVIISLFVITLGVFWLPRYASFYISRIPDPTNNGSTSLMLNFLDTYHRINGFLQLFGKGIIANVEYAVMIVCAAVITAGMRTSLKLKHSSTSNTNQWSSKISTTEISLHSNENKKQLPGKIDSKELRVIQQTLTVVLVNVVFTLPTIVVCVYMFLEPRFEYGAQFNNFYFVAFAFTNTCYAVNTLANFFIYVKYNRRFLDRLNNLNCRRSAKSG